MIWWIIGIFLALQVASLPVMIYVCYRNAFYSPDRQETGEELPQGRIYEPHWTQMRQWSRELEQIPCQQVQITSFDGLTLRGRFYEYAPGAPVELMFHGYRGSSRRDLSGGVQRCFRLGHSALLVDQRGCGRSDGNVITFGICEQRDCLQWVDFLIRQQGSQVRIILTGVSMGAATVMMAAGNPLPPNVIGVLADCGYTTPEEIIRIVLRKQRLLVNMVYPFVRLSARLLGGFRLHSDSPIEAMKRCKVPVIFFHGECDDFVPCEMSRQLYEACASRKKLVTVPGAGHGLCYLTDPELYIQQLQEFEAFDRPVTQ